MDNKKIFWKNAMNYGAILGPIMFIFITISELYGLGLVALLNYAIIILFIIYGTKNFRDNHNNGFIKYGRAVAIGTLILTFAGIIHTFLYSLLMRISPEIKDKIIRQSEERLLERGFSEDMVEIFSKSQNEISNPLLMVFAGIFVYGIIGLIISLFTSIFLRKEANPFQNVGGDGSDINQPNQISGQ